MLSSLQEKALLALLCSPSIAEAAKKSGASERSLIRWMGQPEFRQQYRDARAQVVEQAIAEVQAATSEAVATLRRNLTAKQPGDQIRAASKIIATAMQGVELVDLVEKLEHLESQIIALNSSKGVLHAIK
jgi:hypothetical protein